MGDGFASSMSDIFDDLFGDMMGRRGAAGSPRASERGADLRYNLEITLEEAFRGKNATIKLPTSVDLRDLRRLRARKRGLEADDLQDLRRPRPRSRAAGLLRHRAHLPDLPRPRPDDRQSLRPMRRLRPRDARAHAVGQRSRRRRGRHAHSPDRRGRGGTCAAERPAISIFSLPIKPHPFFQRDGADLYCRVPISMVQAALGGEFTVRTLDGGDAKVRVPEGAQSGRQLRLRGKGMPVLRSRDFGDLYIQAVVETPQNLTRRQRELLAEFDAESSNKTHPESAGFFAKMKEFFEGRS